MRILLDGDRSVHSHAPAILTEQKVERATQSTLALPGIPAMKKGWPLKS